LTVQAWQEVLYIDSVAAQGFEVLHRVITRTPLGRGPARPDIVSAVVSAMQAACQLRGERPVCLQRAAVITRLLRRHGIPAALVIGYHAPPLTGHAWVEVADEVVSEDQRAVVHYSVLDRW
jgi:hypothetical protein